MNPTRRDRQCYAQFWAALILIAGLHAKQLSAQAACPPGCYTTGSYARETLNPSRRL
jgi:hypothetical protein